MPLSTAAKAVLCICPPAVMAGAVATVPAAKRAVHHLTAPHHAPKAARHFTTAPAPAHSSAQRRADCDPAAIGAPTGVPLVTYAVPIPDEPGATEAGTAPATVGTLVAGPPTVVAPAAVSPAIVSPGVTQPGATPPGVSSPGVSVSPDPGAVPEPASWIMLIAGVGTMGAALRRRRKAVGVAGFGAQAAGGATLWGASAVAEASDVAATLAVKSTVASVATKAILCVCPAAVVAGSIMTVPPLRRAVHASTIPAAAPPVIAGGYRTALPCDGPMTVPVSSAAIKGFPESVTTVVPITSSTAAAANAALLRPVSLADPN